MEDEIIELAKRAIRSWVEDGERIQIPKDLPSHLKNQQRGTFVSLKKSGKLRGCIGTYEPAENNLAEEIVRNAIQAVQKDPRFPPVEASELDQLLVSVDVLSTPEPCKEEDLDPQRYGIIVSKGRQRGVLLPDLEGVNTISEQVEIAKKKAGITTDQGYELQRFEVERHTSDTPINS